MTHAADMTDSAPSLTSKPASSQLRRGRSTERHSGGDMSVLGQPPANGPRGRVLRTNRRPAQMQQSPWSAQRAGPAMTDIMTHDT